MLDCLKNGLDFSQGKIFRSEVKSSLNATVHLLGKANHFLLVVSFGRSNFRLLDDSVSLALESCLGGSAEDLAVHFLRDRVLRFSVSSRQVGFMVLALKSVSCKDFKCFFHTWGQGGPNWQRECRFWEKECEKEWTLVSPDKHACELAMKVLKKKPEKPILIKNRNTNGVKRAISFGSVLEYEACPGYHFPATHGIQDHIDPSTSPNIQFGSFKGKAMDDPSKATIAPQSPNSKQKENPANWPDQTHPNGMDSLSEVVNDIAFRFWDCSRCMSMGHHISACQNKIRCRACYRLGHKERNCTAWTLHLQKPQSV